MLNALTAAMASAFSGQSQPSFAWRVVARFGDLGSAPQLLIEPLRQRHGGLEALVFFLGPGAGQAGQAVSVSFQSRLEKVRVGALRGFCG